MKEETEGRKGNMKEETEGEEGKYKGRDGR